VAGAAALALSLAACSGSGNPLPSNGASTSSTSGSSGGGSALQTLCNDILLIQSGFRPDALQRFLDRLKEDHQAFLDQGDKATAKAVAAVEVATAKLRQALLNQKNVQQAQAAFADAIKKLPTC